MNSHPAGIHIEHAEILTRIKAPGLCQHITPERRQTKIWNKTFLQNNTKGENDETNKCVTNYGILKLGIESIRSQDKFQATGNINVRRSN